MFEICSGDLVFTRVPATITTDSRNVSVCSLSPLLSRPRTIVNHPVVFAVSRIFYLIHNLKMTPKNSLLMIGRK